MDEMLRRWIVAEVHRRTKTNAYRAPGVVTLQGAERILERSNCRCAYCRDLLDFTLTGSWHLEHVQPVSRGGLNVEQNLVLSCAECNLSKGTLTGTEYMRACRTAMGARRRKQAVRLGQLHRIIVPQRIIVSEAATMEAADRIAIRMLGFSGDGKGRERIKEMIEAQGGRIDFVVPARIKRRPERPRSVVRRELLHIVPEPLSPEELDRLYAEDGKET